MNKYLVIPFILICLVVAAFVVQPVSSQAVSAVPTATSGNGPAIDTDGYYATWLNAMMCKNPQTPYFFIQYSLKGNTPGCSSIRIKPPVQVMEGQACPPNTTRQLIYPNEGSEAVCLPKTGAP
ncbi:hypothetical protein A3K29_04335 [Candidatus Collierbacteria bacterium RIFOXYB2_FULL_46_14]|nr:MAG: hypothetical protein A3K29_04335 [Candidatus Collierbacteria bacterium RIFOXYB2_FULL_46_14]OGD76371.1 MAG: hypothetical protein A3K43_04335 [Candidatus Collierbacteria bacterium RIFOXYA2_FULL_46_20]OGD77707.1 MAG: hypothetical protein A3K39_04335 [Candidatus Collierbacteria bacterium RIFOXYC2_FULL_43_15]OGD80997.1 MAG: hypothetical protein A2320_04830 [Pseudomonadales bacterium GWC2_63_15]OGD82429.1 MAG: hypothetical protein A3K36_04335 [Candidatus Collierbacteria bacterium RIFOXYD2_FUL